jgi:hypothetical protein
MKKEILSVFICLTLTIGAFAQNGAFSKGDKLLNIGIGVNSYYGRGIPFGASFEYGITDDISVGGNVDYFSESYRFAGDRYRYRVMYFGARGAYHFNNLLNINNDAVDLYGGLTLGFRNFSWNNSWDDDLDGVYSSGLFLGAFIGGKYYFSKNISGFAELGAIGSTNGRIGIAFRF